MSSSASEAVVNQVETPKSREATPPVAAPTVSRATPTPPPTSQPAQQTEPQEPASRENNTPDKSDSERTADAIDNKVEMPSQPQQTQEEPEPENEDSNNKIPKVVIKVEDEKVIEKNGRNVEEDEEDIPIYLRKSEPDSNKDNNSGSTTIEEAGPVIKKDTMELKYKYREGESRPLGLSLFCFVYFVLFYSII